MHVRSSVFAASDDLFTSLSGVISDGNARSSKSSSTATNNNTDNNARRAAEKQEEEEEEREELRRRALDPEREERYEVSMRLWEASSRLNGGKPIRPHHQPVGNGSAQFYPSNFLLAPVPMFDTDKIDPKANNRSGSLAFVTCNYISINPHSLTRARSFKSTIWTTWVGRTSRARTRRPAFAPVSLETATTTSPPRRLLRRRQPQQQQ